jgi:hypothetical protein
MTRTYQIVIGVAILVSFLLMITFTSLKEGFQADTPEAAKSQEITSFMTTASEVLCPPLKAIVEDKQRDYEGSDAEKLEKAMVATAKEAGGTVFPCPPPDNPLAVPADIEERLNRTLTYVQTQLNTSLTTIKESLDCKGVAVTQGFWSTTLDHLEPFENVCTTQQLSEKQADSKERAAKAAVQSCVAPQDVTPQLGLQILKQRADALNRVMGKEKTPILMAQIQTAYKELQSLKNRAQSGMIQSSCPT